jgi:serine/threonine-protein kinase
MAEEVVRTAPSTRPAARVAELAAQIPDEEEPGDDRAATVTIPRGDTPRARRSRRRRWIVGIVVLLAVLGVGAWAAWTYAIPHYTEVPAVTGLPVDRAIQELQDAGLRVTQVPAEFSSDVPSGSVIRTDPAPGGRVRTRTVVSIVPSKGPDLRPVPDVVGKSEARAKELIEAAGLQWRVSQDYDDVILKGRVIRQTPDPETKLEKGKRVTITVSLGPPLVEIPDVSGQTGKDAIATLEALHFDVGTPQQEYSTTVPKGEVIRTDPPAHQEIPKFSSVTIVVSLGPKTFDMPNVIGMATGDAVTQLEGMGLRVVVKRLPSNNPPDEVVFTDPNPGDTVQQGQIVTLYATYP